MLIIHNNRPIVHLLEDHTKGVVTLLRHRDGPNALFTSVEQTDNAKDYYGAIAAGPSRG